MRLKKCKLCNLDQPLENFSSTMAKYCKPCKRIRAFEKQRESRQRQIDKLKTRVKKTTSKTKRKTIAQEKKSTQRVVNRFIKDRDISRPCISCNQPITDAGHYIAQGSSGYLRYHPENIHGQDMRCNRYKSGNLIEYRISLIKKIGEDRVLWLEENRHKIHKYTREQLEQIKQACRSGVYDTETWETIMLS